MPCDRLLIFFRRTLGREDLAWIENVVGVKEIFDLAHKGEGRLVKLHG